MTTSHKKNHRLGCASIGSEDDLNGGANRVMRYTAYKNKRLCGIAHGQRLGSVTCNKEILISGCTDREIGDE